MEVIKLGTKIYKICPICNDRHRVSQKCSDCAWGGCLGWCDVGVSLYSDGSGCGRDKELQIIEITCHTGNQYYIHEKYNIMYFTDREKAERAMAEYKAICGMKTSKYDPKFTKKQLAEYHNESEVMYKAYREWCDERKHENPLG